MASVAWPEAWILTAVAWTPLAVTVPVVRISTVPPPTAMPADQSPIASIPPAGIESASPASTLMPVASSPRVVTLLVTLPSVCA